MQRKETTLLCSGILRIVLHFNSIVWSQNAEPLREIFISSAQTTVVIETPPSECTYDLIFGCFSEILLNSYAFNFWKKKCLGKEVSMKNISAIWELQLTERNRLFLIYVYKHTKWCWRTLDSPSFSECNEKSSPHNLTYNLSHTYWCYSPMEEKQWGLSILFPHSQQAIPRILWYWTRSSTDSSSSPFVYINEKHFDCTVEW